MNLKLPSETIFYTIESTIKAYRKYAQKHISIIVKDITIDQGLVLLFLNEYKELTQKEIAKLAFKDNASMTRMINTMVLKKYLKRSINIEDRRRYKIELTKKGKNVVNKLPPIIQSNRKTALIGITKDELEVLETILNKIKSNCNKNQ